MTSPATYGFSIEQEQRWLYRCMPCLECKVAFRVKFRVRQVEYDISPGHILIYEIPEPGHDCAGTVPGNDVEEPVVNLEYER